MPARAVLKIQGAANKTRWTLRSDNTPIQSPSVEQDEIMQANGGYYGHGHGHAQDHGSLQAYESYDGSEYSPVSGRMSENSGYRQPEAVNGGYNGFDFQQSAQMGNRQSLNLNTRVRSFQTHDAVGRHLLYETALMDTQTFEILNIEEVDALKKEHVRLISKIEAAQRKLALESKVRDAAQNLQRLYSTNKRPDTPQDPESPKKNRSSLLGTRHRGASSGSAGGEHLLQTDSEVLSSVKKVDDLHVQVKELLERREYVERKLLRHTSAVLAEEANRVAESAVPGLVNGHHIDDDDDRGYNYNDFDGIRDILHGMPAGASNKVQQHEQPLASMQDRLDHLNSQLRNIISEAGQALGKRLSAEVGLDQSEDSSVRIENRFTRLESNIFTLQQQQRDVKTNLQQQHANQNAAEKELESLNHQLHSAVLLASNDQPVPGLEEPPHISGEGYQTQIQYMEESLMTMEQLLQQHAHSDAAAKAEKADEYETVLGGLWEILQSDHSLATPRIGGTADDEDEDEAPRTPMQEGFSLPSFSSRVQHLFDKSQRARDEQEILRRQIQQQRDLNDKSDVEKDRQLSELQSQHEDLNTQHSTFQTEHATLQQELANAIVRHQHSDEEAKTSRSELESTMREVEELKKTIASKQTERDDLDRQIAGSQDLEGEVVRLTTELTMAKAELDGAYGTREQRRGAQADEVRSLKEELGAMASEFQDLTKESLELERERESLDRLIDSLRERCEVLESQLGDEKVRWMGIKSPGQPGDGPGGAAQTREGVSVGILRQEFKKMVRETRMEGMKVVRAEQEERRRLEAELRKIRQANGPLAKNGLSNGTSGGNVNGSTAGGEDESRSVTPSAA